MAAFGFICGTRAGFRLEGSRRFKCGLGPFGVSGLFNCRRFFSFVALGLFSCSFALFFVLLLWLSHFVTFVLGQSVRVWTWFQGVLRGADCFIHLLGCISLRVSIGVFARLTSFAHQPPNADHSFLQIIFCHTPTNSEMPPKAIVDRGDNSIPRPRSGGTSRPTTTSGGGLTFERS